MEGEIASALVATFGAPQGIACDLSYRVRAGLQERNSRLVLTMCHQDVPEYGCAIGRYEEKAQELAEQCRLPILSQLRFSTAITMGPQTLCTLVMCEAGLTAVHARWIGDGLKKNPLLHSLQLGCNKLGPDGVSAIARGLSGNTNLRFLGLGYVMVEEDDETWRGLAELFQAKAPFLVRLNVAGHVFKKKAFEKLADWLKDNPRLEYLNLSSTNCRQAFDFSSALRTNTNLKELSLSLVQSFSLKSKGVEKLNLLWCKGRENIAACLSANPTLKKLQVNCYHSDINEDSLIAIRTMTSLKGLSLESGVNVDFAKRLVETCTNLQSISFYGAFAETDDGVSVISSLLISNANLTSLDVGRCSLSAATCKIVFEANPRLKKLNLSANGFVGVEGAEWIGKWLRINRTLSNLNLTGCSITGEGVQFIASGLMTNSSLKILLLGYNEIGDIGTSYLGKALKQNKSLEKLVLPQNGITEEGARTLASDLCWNRCLTILDVSDNGHIGHVMLKMLEVNSAILQLYYDYGNSKNLNRLLERNFNSRHAARRAVYCFLWCFEKNRASMSLGQLNKLTIKKIAQLIWSTRKDQEWLEAVIKLY